MGTRRLSNLLCVDDAPFEKNHRGDVPLVGAVMARTRLDGVMYGKVRRDGVNSTRAIETMVRTGPFREHVQAVVLSGISFAGFNVADPQALFELSGKPVLVIARHKPRYEAIRRALLGRVPGGKRKWELIERAGEMEPVESLWVQCAGMTSGEAALLIRGSRLHGPLPEGVRLAHLLGAALVRGVSHGAA